MMMKILLINPEFPDTYWSFRHAVRFEGKRSVFPPLGLLTVSALLPPSWERRLVDLNVQSLKSADIELRATRRVAKKVAGGRSPRRPPDLMMKRIAPRRGARLRISL
jgi:hypothetical protein